MEEKKICAGCFEEIKGGTYIEKPEKRMYFCSAECLDEYNRQKENQDE